MEDYYVIIYPVPRFAVESEEVEIAKEGVEEPLVTLTGAMDPWRIRIMIDGTSDNKQAERRCYLINHYLRKQILS